MIRDLIGCRYKVHGRNKDEGFDCYGIAIEVLKRAGITLPDAFYDDTQRETNRSTMDSLEAAIPNTEIPRPEKNCIIEFTEFGVPAHIGVYIGGGEFIHSTKDVGVVIDKLHRYRRRVKGYYRVNN